MEAWRRIDPRIRWIDIHMRIENTSTKPSLDVLRSRISRQRVSYCMLSWWLPPSAASNAHVLDALSPMQWSTNTTRGATPGLVNPAANNSERVLHPGEENTVETDSEEGSAQTATDLSDSDSAEESVASSDSLAYQDQSGGLFDSDEVEEPVSRQIPIPLTNCTKYDNND